MELQIFWVDRFSVPERMPHACGGSETSRQGSELLQIKSASTENWIGEELISPASGECPSSKTPNQRKR